MKVNIWHGETTYPDVEIINNDSHPDDAGEAVEVPDAVVAEYVEATRRWQSACAAVLAYRRGLP